MSLEALSVYGGFVLVTTLLVLFFTFIRLYFKSFNRLVASLTCLIGSWLVYRAYWVYFWMYVNDDWRLALFVPLWVWVMAAFASWTTYELLRPKKHII